jgi:hypothetical protein
MKNLHLIPTNKPSRLCKTDKLRLYPNGLTPKSQGLCKNQNICITNDEVIKERDWYIADNKVYRASVDHMPELYTYPCKKIILTTDIDLIENGVQAIDDEFLEWFVKNQSCEEVEIGEGVRYEDEWIDNEDGGEIYQHQYCCYKIIIPKEEPKQEIIEDKIYQAIGLSANKQGIINQALATSKVMDILKKEIIVKQETLEEAAERLYPYIEGEETLNAQNSEGRTDFIAGAKWQQERSYSEEDLKNAFNSAREFNSLDGVVDVHIVLPMGGDMSDLQPLHFTFDEWFEQFKKK